MTNLFTDFPSNLPDELFTTLLEAANVRIERIISHGHASPEDFWYDTLRSFPQQYTKKPLLRSQES